MINKKKKHTVNGLVEVTVTHTNVPRKNIVYDNSAGDGV